LLAVIAALTLAACGGDDGGSGGGGDGADARTLLEETATNTMDVRSGAVALALDVAADGESLDLRVDGAFEQVEGAEWPKFDFSADASIPRSGNFSVGAISTSDRLYVEVEDQAYEVPAELLAQMQRAPRGEGIGGLTVPGLDLQSWIDDAEVAGEEEVGGADTYHVTGTVNVSQLLDSLDRVLAEADREGLSGVTGGQVPRSIPADARAEIEEAVRSAEIDVWTGKDDKILRKLEVDLAVEPRGDESGTISLVLELTDPNEPQTIEAPARTRPIDELLAGLGALLGSSGLGDLGGAAPQEGAGDYARCITEAGADLEEAQKCADLLGG